MTTNPNKYLFWIPRILSILFILFLTLMSLDVYSRDQSLHQLLIGLFLHNIPVYILSVVLVISWRYELVGGIIFIIAGLLYIATILMNMYQYQFQGYMVSYSLIVAGPLIFVGILFILNWRNKCKRRKK